MPYLIVVNILWAFSFSLIGEYLAGRVDSDFAVLVRVAIAALVFIPFTRWRGVPRPLLAGLWLAGALQFGVTYLCLYRSFGVLTVPEVLLFTVLTPIYVTLLDDALARRFNPWALVAALVAVGGGVLIRFQHLEGDYLAGFVLLQIANATFAAGQVLCRHLLIRYPTDWPLYRFFSHFFLGALGGRASRPSRSSAIPPACPRPRCNGGCWCGWACLPPPWACSGGSRAAPAWMRERWR
jgi:drug/metabolite transporter (DMT)-like permease